MTLPASFIVSEGLAGLQAQGLGLAEAAGFTPQIVALTPRRPWSWLPAAYWPNPVKAVGLSPLPDGLIFTVGGKAAAVGAQLRRPKRRVVQVQNPRLDLRKFDLVVANRHDEISGPNVIVTRTALHRVTQKRLAAARARWEPVFAHIPHPRVAVLVGGSNGRFRLEQDEGRVLARQLSGLLGEAGIMITPSRRTSPEVRRILAQQLVPNGAYIWDMQGENPYFGLLALADAIIVTMDSVSMVSEAVATHAPVFVASQPGKSRRIDLFLQGLLDDGRIRLFQGHLDLWPAMPLDDTAAAAAEMMRRLDLTG